MEIAEVNKALEFLKSKYNGELPYKFGKQEIGRWMAEYAKEHAKEASEIINELLDTISWLGGNAYEMDCINSVRNRAEEF